MHNLIQREISSFVLENLEVFPAVVILGSRQCGKSTLIKMMAKELKEYLYLDLQDREDLVKLVEPGLFFSNNQNSTICLDEIQNMPQLFSILRSEIDKDRRNGRFILLGSASQEILRQTSESLAGRVGIIDLGTFSVSEAMRVPSFQLDKYWFRGGYPNSYLAKSDAASRLWCENFLRTYVERDIPQLGLTIPSQLMMRMLTMLGHLQGQVFNASKLGESLGISHPTVKRYLDVLEHTYLVRILRPFEINVKKRLVKSPKVFIRDSGLLHRLLLINSFSDLIGHPVFGSSWEGLVIENLIISLKDCKFSFFRSATGFEIDLIVQKADQIIAIECKASTAPQLTKGFWKAHELIKPDHSFVVAPVQESYSISKQVSVTNLHGIFDELRMLNAEFRR